MAAYHKFKVTEKNGLTEDDLGEEIDLKCSYRYSKNVSFEALVGQAAVSGWLESDLRPVSEPAGLEAPAAAARVSFFRAGTA
jgi:hypothetical protein